MCARTKAHRDSGPTTLSTHCAKRLAFPFHASGLCHLWDRQELIQPLGDGLNALPVVHGSCPTLQEVSPVAYVLQLLADQGASNVLPHLGRHARICKVKGLDSAMMYVHGNANVVLCIGQEVELWCLRPHPVIGLSLSVRGFRRMRLDTYAKLVVAFLDIWDAEVVVANCLHDAWLANMGIHFSKLCLQMLLERLHVQPDVPHG